MGDTDIRYYLSVLVRRLPYLVAIAGLCTALGLAIAYLAPPVYQASARILVEPPQIPAEMAPPTVQTNALEQLQIIEQQITTRDYLVDLARRLDIYGPMASSLSEAQIVDNLRQRTTLEQLQIDSTRGGAGATVFKVAFEARQPELAASVVNDIVAFILSQNIGLRTSKAEDTMEFFDREVARLGSELAVLEKRVLDFRNANKDALPDSIDFRRTQRGNQQERLLLLEREESGLRVRRINLVRLFEATGQTAGAGPLSPEQEMLRDLKRALAEQLALFSENSPNVLALRTRIDAVQQGLQASGPEDGEAAPSALDMQLSEIDERLDFIARERATIDAYLEDLNSSIDATPANETWLNALERSRANIQMQYNTAIAKLAAASTGEQIEIGSKAGRFSIVEPATPPQSTVSPNRRRIAGAGLIGGIGLGLGFVILLEIVNRSVRRPGELTSLLQKQPLATVPYIWLPREKRAARTRLAAGFAAAAVVAGLLGVAMQHYRQPMASAFEHLIVSLDAGRMM